MVRKNNECKNCEYCRTVVKTNVSSGEICQHEYDVHHVYCGCFMTPNNGQWVATADCPKKKEKM